MDDFSQNGEQVEILKHFNGRIGNFLDIGAFDGETFSNTRALAILGWSGTLVEPSYIAFGKLRALYKDEIRFNLVNCAISGAVSAMLEFTPDEVGHVSSAKPDQKTRHPDASWMSPYWISGLQVEFILSFGKFDFISVDAEGFDMEIAESIPKDHLPEMICVEHGQRSILEWDYWAISRGYEKLMTTNENFLFIK